MEHAGHRKRLIEKLGMGILPEHEVLEALLFNAVPRINTNDLAHRLLARFGSVPAVLGSFVGILSGSMIIERIFSIPGVGELYLGAILSQDYNFFMMLSGKQKKFVP